MKKRSTTTVFESQRWLLILVSLIISVILVVFRYSTSHNATSGCRHGDTSLVAVAECRLQRGNLLKKKAISVIYFSSGGETRTDLLEMAAYSLEKLAKTENYIVAVLDSASMEVCLGVGPPCADASSLFEDSGRDVPQDADTFMSPAYVETTWKKVRVTYELMKHGFSVHSSDYDVWYAPKDSLWKNYLEYITKGNADAAFQVEMAGINTGNYVILHSERALRFMEQWLELQGHGDNDQVALNNAILSGDRSWKNVSMCVEECPKSREDAFIIRRYYPPFWSRYHDHCLFNGKTDLKDFDPCHPSLLYVHPICTGGGRTTDVKMSVFDSLNVHKTTHCDSSGVWDPFTDHS